MPRNTDRKYKTGRVLAAFVDLCERALHMDVLPRITRQLIDLLRDMSLVQRMTVVVIPIALLLAFGSLLFLNPGTDFRELSFGKSFTTDELSSAEQALAAAGLTGFRRDGQRLLAPGKELDRYNAALLQSDALPGDLGAQMLKQYETLGPFSTDRQRQQMKEALLLQELRRIIKAVPDIQDARVVIAASERRGGWNQKPRTSANVMVKPRSGHEISAMLVNSLRHVVASMVPDLNPVDVTIFDVSKGQAFTGESSDNPSDSRFLQHAQALTRQYEKQIHKALSFIPNVGVTAHVDFDSLKSAMIHNETVRSRGDDLPPAVREVDIDGDSHQTSFRGPLNRSSETVREVTDKQLVASMPRSVRVSVSIPREYIHEVSSRQLSKGDSGSERADPHFVEEDVIAKVEQIVGRLIPADSPDDAISVTCVDRLDQDVADVISFSWPEQLGMLTHNWGSSLALSILAIVALWMLRRGSGVVVPPSDPVQSPPTELVEFVAPIEPSPIPDPVIPPERIEILCKDVRSMVESDDSASATLLGRWLSGAGQAGADGARKAGILLLSLDQGLAAKALGRMPRDQVERITLTIAGIEDVQRDEQESTLDEFKAMFASRPLMKVAGPDTARELLERTLDRIEVEPLKQRIEEQIQSGPFGFLYDWHPDDIRRLIEDEHPQSVAVVCAQMPASLAAQVLAGFGAESQAEILGRVARMGPTDPDLLVDMAALLRDRFSGNPVRKGGPARAADVLREAPRATSRSVLQSLDRNDANLAETLRSSMFSFKDLATLDDAAMQIVLQKTDHLAWAVALKGCSEEIRQRVFKGMSAKMAQALKDEIHSVGPLRLSEIKAVQQQIADAIVKLESDNEIELPRRLSRFSRAGTV